MFLSQAPVVAEASGHCLWSEQLRLGPCQHVATADHALVSPGAMLARGSRHVQSKKRDVSKLGFFAMNRYWRSHCNSWTGEHININIKSNFARKMAVKELDTNQTGHFRDWGDTQILLENITSNLTFASGRLFNYTFLSWSPLWTCSCSGHSSVPEIKLTLVSVTF